MGTAGTPDLPSIADLSADAVADRFVAAREAQAIWRRYTLTQRVERLRSFWSALMADKERLAAVLHEETGKPLPEIETMEFGTASLIVKYFTRNAHRILQDQAVSKPWIFLNKRAYVRFAPRGVIGIITPWNLPFLIPVGDAIPALLAGNAVVLKPSEWTPRTALFIEDKFRSCGLFPEGLFQVATGKGAAGAAVTACADMVLFTGSVKTGRAVLKAAAERMVPVVLELGGKHSMLVAKDAPLARAVKAAVWGRFANCGQLCVGVERVFVEEPLYRTFCEALIAETGRLRQGISRGYDVDLGRLIFPGQLAVVERHLEDAKAKGARVIGGGVVDRSRLMVAPALVLDARADMLVMKEETFGPVLAVAPVRRLEDAVRIANDGPHGLAASVWTRNLARGEALGGMLEAGLLSVNDVLSHYAVTSLPFGGMKESGLGRRHSEEGLRMFCHSQSVLVHEWPADQPEPWWFPYDRLKTKVVGFLTRLA